MHERERDMRERILERGCRLGVLTAVGRRRGVGVGRKGEGGGRVERGGEREG